MRHNYNYTRRKLYLPEYGRHIHEMVDSLLTIEDRAERTRQAKAVIAVMGNLNPLLRDTADFTHKLWDHLFIMSDFRLDVDSPYQQPSRQDLTIVPQKMPYPQTRIMFKHYGKYAQRFVQVVATKANSRSAEYEMANVARYMRSKSYEYNNEHPNNDSIIRDIHLMADGPVEVDLTAISTMRSEYRQGSSSRPQKRNKMQRNGGQRKQQRNSNRGTHPHHHSSHR